jgi:hypothetical protein
MTISEILPDIRAGPILLNFSPEYRELLSFFSSDLTFSSAIKLVLKKRNDIIIDRK